MPIRCVRNRRAAVPLRVAVLAGLISVQPITAHATTLFGLVDTGELFASIDEGESWQIRATLAVHDAVALAAGATPSDLYLVTTSGVFYSSNAAGES
jgi:photosystem II stability/assembly factor-like uncharacterized protein